MLQISSFHTIFGSQSVEEQLNQYHVPWIVVIIIVWQYLILWIATDYNIFICSCWIALIVIEIALIVVENVVDIIEIVVDKLVLALNCWLIAWLVRNPQNMVFKPFMVGFVSFSTANARIELTIHFEHHPVLAPHLDRIPTLQCFQKKYASEFWRICCNCPMMKIFYGLSTKFFFFFSL